MADIEDERELEKLKQKEGLDSQKIKELEHQNECLKKLLVEEEDKLKLTSEDLQSVNGKMADQKEKIETNAFKQKEELFSVKSNMVKLTQELELTNRKLEKKTKELDITNRKIVQQTNKLDTADVLLVKIKDKLICPVCLNIPSCGPVFLCNNGHLVCQKCKRDSCPMCRTVMGHGPGKSLLAVTILENIDYKCKFDECEEVFAKEKLNNHELVCYHRIVNCPSCSKTITLSELVSHSLNSNCLNDQELVILVVSCQSQTLNYSGPVNDNVGDSKWTMRIYKIRDQNFVIFPMKSDSYFYFVVVMFASENVCSKYKFEIIVHGKKETNALLDSEVIVKYQGHPLSVDLKEEELKLFGTSQKFMDDKKGFSITFKVSYS